MVKVGNVSLSSEIRWMEEEPSEFEKEESAPEDDDDHESVVQQVQRKSEPLKVE